ncbi:MAG: dihydrofolate reductase [Halobacteriaceae archaeon]
MDVVIIAAVAANGVIGADGGIPWDLPADLAHFKRATTGHPVIMGRRTYESIADRIGGPLPERTNVVLTTRNLDAPESVRTAESVDVALHHAEQTGADRAYVAGGATVYEQFLPRADRMVLTELDDAYEGDTHFPTWDEDAWTAVARDERDGFAFVTYERD